MVKLRTLVLSTLFIFLLLPISQSYAGLNDTGVIAIFQFFADYLAATITVGDGFFNEGDVLLIDYDLLDSENLATAQAHETARLYHHGQYDWTETDVGLVLEPAVKDAHIDIIPLPSLPAITGKMRPHRL